ncbi:MAG: sulfurtransferase-like selenium metabolism protein YedF [Filifactoraceae bacterium]
MEKIIDCRGLDCPKPVLKTIKALEEGGFDTLMVQVDNLTARENVTRLANSKNLSSSFEEKPFGFEIKILVEGGILFSEIKEDSTNEGRIYVIKSDKLGEGAEELGKILMNGFLFTLTQTDPIPNRIVLLNSGVYLSTNTEESVRHLQALSDKGTKIYSCGTCLNFYGLSEDLKVGEVGNMYDVVDSISGDIPAITL